MMTMVLLLMSMILRLVPPACDAAAVRLTVLDGTNTPVVGLTLSITDQTGQPQVLTTNSAGVVTATGLNGPFFRVLAARLPNGQAVPIDATTLDAGLRLGLLPCQERQVALRLAQNLLFVDPEAIFASEPPPVTPTVPPPSPPRAAPGADAVPMDAPVRVASADAAFSPARALLLLALPVLLAAIIWLRQVVRYQRQRRGL